MYNYEIGMKVVCISRGRGFDLVIDKIYTIEGMSKCCQLHLDVGLVLIQEGSCCPVCGDITKSHIVWSRSKLFIPLSAYTQQEEAVQELLKEEKIEV